MVTALLVIPAYLLGTFPTAILVMRAKGRDVTSEGSGNPGASNVTRLLGLKWGLVVFLGDVLKGAIGAGVGLAIQGRASAYVLGLAAMLGHVFPVTRGFKGGRGVASAAGMMLVLMPIVTLILIGGWILIAYGLKRASIASLVASAALPLLAWADGRARAEILVLTGVTLLILARHGANLRRLVRGEEHRIDRRPRTSP